MPKVISWASREKRRAVNAAVGRNFVKTITEPLTNSDSILKKQSGVAHAAGLVDEILGLKPTERLNTSDLKKRLPKASLRKIRIEIATAGDDARLCKVVDAGSGMTRAELEDKFSSYASAKAKGEKRAAYSGAAPSMSYSITKNQ